MTEKERIEKTYEKIHKKYPDVISKDEVDRLAIREDKKMTLLYAFAWLLGGIVFGVILFSQWGRMSDSMTIIFMMMTGSGFFEFFRTLSKYSKIEKRYRPVAVVRNEGLLTNDSIVKRGGRKLKNAGAPYIIVKAALVDKNDELETGSDNETHHTYTLYFEYAGKLSLNVKRSVYMDAVLGVDYFLILIPGKVVDSYELVDVYQASNWVIAEELRPMYKGDDFDLMNRNTEFAAEVEKKKKSGKTMAIIALVLAAVGIFVNVLLGLMASIAAIVLSAISNGKAKCKLSTISFVVSIISFVLNVLYFAVILFGII